MSYAGFPTGLISSEDIEGVEKSPFEKEVCEIGGWDAPVDVGRCSAENLKYFSSLMFVDSPYSFIAQLIMIPFSVVMVLIIIKALPFT